MTFLSRPLTTDELRNATGDDLSAQPVIDYVTTKYSDLYDL